MTNRLQILWGQMQIMVGHLFRFMADHGPQHLAGDAFGNGSRIEEVSERMERQHSACRFYLCLSDHLLQRLGEETVPIWSGTVSGEDEFVALPVLAKGYQEGVHPFRNRHDTHLSALHLFLAGGIRPSVPGEDMVARHILDTQSPYLSEPHAGECGDEAGDISAL